MDQQHDDKCDDCSNEIGILKIRGIILYFKPLYVVAIILNGVQRNK